MQTETHPTMGTPTETFALSASNRITLKYLTLIQEAIIEAIDTLEVIDADDGNADALIAKLYRAKAAAMGQEPDMAHVPAKAEATRIDVTKITEALIDEACRNPDLDAALQPLMQAAGIISGDVAATVFSNSAKGVATNSEYWPKATEAQRLAAILEWIEEEKGQAEIDADDDGGAA